MTHVVAALPLLTSLLGTVLIKSSLVLIRGTIHRSVQTTEIDLIGETLAMDVGPCHHGMARPQVADGGTASYMEGSCE
jgi:hypothetical protein